MPTTSIIIPSRNELFLTKTINDLLEKGGDIEVIAVVDGYWPEPENLPALPEDKRLHIIHFGMAMGMRNAINSAAAIARGKYLLKCDAHCMFMENYDEILAANCDDNWVVIPRRFSLDAENWKIDDNAKPPRDYHYLCYPHWDKPHDAGMHGVEWWDRGVDRSDTQYDIDDNMSCQGSCWFMSKAHFDKFLGGLSEVGYGTFTQEFQEIGNKTWLGGGEVKVNKKVWYAHLHKGKTYGRMWRMGRVDQEAVVAGHAWSARHWMMNEWEGRVHDFEWLIEKFSPVPTWSDFGSVEEAFKAWREHYGYA